MGYRRSHYRRAHTRTNQDGSKSYVKDSYVQGHEYNKKEDFSNIYSTASAKESFLSILILIWLSSVVLSWLGIFLDWDGVGWYSIIGIISFVIVLLSCNK